MIRKARVRDIPALLAIEKACFTSDLFTQRSFHHLLIKAHATTLVEEDDEGTLVGYVTVLFNRGTSLARLYSMAVRPDVQHRGAGRRLLEAIEDEARAHDNAYMRLEVRADNLSAQRLYERAGYRRFGVAPHYYQDGVDALRMEKLLAAHLDPSRSRVPYHEQTLDFTCGAAALMMAMKALDPASPMDSTTELRLWRESTTIFMCSGHGGCGPYGLALAAYRRGFDVEVFVNETGTLFAGSVRNPERRQAMELVQEDFLAQLRETGVRMHHEPVNLVVLEERFTAGAIPVVLVSTYRLDSEKQPHWVVVTGLDERFVYLHDPFVDPESGKTRTDRMHIPILRKDFERMAKYGRSQLKAALLLRQRMENDAKPHRRRRTRG